MQRRRRFLFQLPLPFPREGSLNPLSDLAVVVLMGRLDGGGGEVLAALGGFFVFLGDDVGFEKGRQPGVLQEHGIGGAQFRDLVEAAGGEVVGGGGEFVLWEVWGVAVDNGLGGVSQRDVPKLKTARHNEDLRKAG